MSTVGIIGLGYVGLPLCHLMHAAGHTVIGFDADPVKIDSLARGECYLNHLKKRFGDDFIDRMLKSGRFHPSGDRERYRECDALLICVPTPLGDDKRPDLHYVEETAKGIAEQLPAGENQQLVVLESTTYPGTTRGVIAPILNTAGKAYLLAYSPEREDPGTNHESRSIPKLVGGIDVPSRSAAKKLYETAFDRVIEVGGEDGGAEVAEAAKLLENVYRAVNIALVNETKLVLDALGIDIWEVIEAAATKPFGFQKFTPGPGLGGHCIPIDPYYLSFIAEECGKETRMIRLAGEINTAMPRYVTERTLQALAEKNGKSAEGNSARILILGLAYKPDIDDVRESPSFELIRLFREAGCHVDYSDPHVPRTHRMRRWGDMNLSSVELNARVLKTYDAVVVATAHSSFDWDLIAEHAELIVDTRNALAGRNVRGRLIHA